MDQCYTAAQDKDGFWWLTELQMGCTASEQRLTPSEMAAFVAARTAEGTWFVSEMPGRYVINHV